MASTPSSPPSTTSWRRSPSASPGRTRSPDFARFGASLHTALGLLAEVGDFERFQRPVQLMSYLGLVPSENSSGDRRRQGSITKSGSHHARRLLVEAAWHYRRAPRKGRELRRRQEGQPQTVCAISWCAQQRLHRSWIRLDLERGKRRTLCAVAVARELAGFCWAVSTAD
ncbi:MAG: transposase [Solirubrobacterales bacterium]